MDFTGTNVVITQNPWVWYYTKVMSTPNHDIIVDNLQTNGHLSRPITVVDQHLVVETSTATFESRPQPEGRNRFIGAFSGIWNRINGSVKDQLNQLQSIKLETIPVSAM